MSCSSPGAMHKVKTDRRILQIGNFTLHVGYWVRRMVLYLQLGLSKVTCLQVCSAVRFGIIYIH